MYQRYGKAVKSTSGLTKHVNAFKIPITLPSCQPSKQVAILEYNITNSSNLSSDNNKKNISSGVFNNGNKYIRPEQADTTGSNDDGNIDYLRPTTLN